MNTWKIRYILASYNIGVLLHRYEPILNSKSSFLWDIMQCRPLKTNRHFEEHIAAFSLHSTSRWFLVGITLRS
jgi:hypothetical protein